MSANRGDVTRTCVICARSSAQPFASLFFFFLLLLLLTLSAPKELTKSTSATFQQISSKLYHNKNSITRGQNLGPRPLGSAK